MDKKDIILITGQSGINVRKCLERLNYDYISLEQSISDDYNINFRAFLGQPQYIQNEYWTKTLENIIEKDKLSKPKFLTFHATYFHQSKRELFSPINFSMMSEKLKNRIKMIVVFIDDIYDVYKRLMAKNQIFEDILNKEKTDPFDAIFSSIFNIFFLLNWREMEISHSRSLANLLNTEMYIVATKHPCFMIKNLIENPLNKLKLYYFSHPITSIRKEALDFLPGFVGKLEGLLEKILSYSNMILFYPTTIDELIIKRDKGKNGEFIFHPEIAQRWSLPYRDQLICPPLSSSLKKVNPLNPLNYSINKKNLNEISRLLSFLWSFIYEKQIIPRDYSLVEQSQNGIIAIRPYFEGVRAGGVLGELEYNFLLMKNQDQRQCIIFSCNEDLLKYNVHRLFKRIDEYIEEKPGNLDAQKEKWLENIHSFKGKSPEEIRNKLEKEVLPDNYDFNILSVPDEWRGHSLKKKILRRDEVFKKIFQDLQVDEINEKAEASEIKKKLCYTDYTESKFWEEASTFIDKKFKNKEEE